VDPKLERFFAECRAEWLKAPDVLDTIEDEIEKLYRRGDDEPGVQADFDRLSEIVGQTDRTLTQRVQAVVQLSLPHDRRS
jgi:hypothetical protein